MGEGSGGGGGGGSVSDGARKNWLDNRLVGTWRFAYMGDEGPAYE
jgi:hypothetical protein